MLWYKSCISRGLVTYGWGERRRIAVASVVQVREDDDDDDGGSANTI